MPSVAAPGFTASDVAETFFSTAQRSLSEYWRDASYGKTWAEGDVKGWYTLDQDYSCDETNAIRAAAIAAADADVDFTQYTRVFIIINGMTGTCTWGGLGTLACGTLSSADGSFTASTSWMRQTYFNPADLLRDGVQIAAHEGGHNIGLRHAKFPGFWTRAPRTARRRGQCHRIWRPVFFDGQASQQYVSGGMDRLRPLCCAA
jgi:M6 family metalloprotease-like protein